MHCTDIYIVLYYVTLIGVLFERDTIWALFIGHNNTEKMKNRFVQTHKTRLLIRSFLIFLLIVAPYARIQFHPIYSKREKCALLRASAFSTLKRMTNEDCTCNRMSQRNKCILRFNGIQMVQKRTDIGAHCAVHLVRACVRLEEFAIQKTASDRCECCDAANYDRLTMHWLFTTNECFSIFFTAGLGQG